MIESSLDAEHSILYVHPTAALAPGDFAMLAQKVDAHIEASGTLRGLVIEATAFPGWDSFGGFVAHLRFVRDHHKRIEKVAVVTDSALGSVAEHLASHFVSAQIRHFRVGEMQAARQWVMSQP